MFPDGNFAKCSEDEAMELRKAVKYWVQTSRKSVNRSVARNNAPNKVLV